MKKIHMIAVGGTGMASLASLLKEQGHLVSGCDKPLYSPMKEFVDNLKIDFYEGHSRSHIDLNPDVVIIGNAVHRENEEAKDFIEKGFKYLSMAEAIYEFAIKGRTSVVVAGTHGKTTTTALTAFLLKESGFKTNMILGGIAKNYNSSSLWEDGHFTVVEGDEYETAFFDKEPKFLHYSPDLLIMNNIEMDHLDNFKSEEDLIKAFEKLLAKVKKNGIVLGGTESIPVGKLLFGSDVKYESFGISGGQAWSATEINYKREGTSFRLLYKGRDCGRFLSPLYGAHNLRNCVGAVAASATLSSALHTLREILPNFKGVKRRQEVVCEKNGLTIIDDFGHHPTAIFETTKALRQRYNPERVIVCWEPRSYTCQTKLHESKMPHSFIYANTVLMGPLPINSKISPSERMNLSNV
ncbi:MAG: Mur ligase family protein, partial [Acidobacteria bacterium]|nr:Mur ligase family protein [Acidobacteriota bacterium]